VNTRLEVKPTGQHGHVDIRIGQNVIGAENFTMTVYVSKTKTEIEPWLPLHVNRKSWAAYHFPWLSLSPNYRKGPKWPSAGAYRFATIRVVRLQVTIHVYAVRFMCKQLMALMSLHQPHTISY